jgi:hypothetical protein
LHLALLDNNAGGQKVIELTTEIPVFCKVECVNGALSPIIINLSNISSSDPKQMNGLEVFGSYTHKEPSSNDNSLRVHNQHKIEIHEPRGRQKFDAKSGSFYLTFMSSLDFKLKICISIKKNKLGKVDK